MKRYLCFFGGWTPVKAEKNLLSGCKWCPRWQLGS